MAELFNSTIEALSDFAEVRKNEKINGRFIARSLLTTGYPGIMFLLYITHLTGRRIE